MPLTELLADLPAWAQAIAYLGLGIGCAVMYLVGRAGFKQGLKSLPAESEARVAAVVVEPAALMAATAAIEGLNMTFIGLKSTLNDFCLVSKKQNDLLEDILRELIISREVDARTRPR